MKSPKDLFNEIVALAKAQLPSNEVEEVKADLAEEKNTENKAEPKAEAPQVAQPQIEQPTGVSKAEFDSAINEIKEMYTKVLESLSPKAAKQDVPAALSLENSKEEEVNLSEETEVVEEVVSEVAEEVAPEQTETVEEEVTSEVETEEVKTEETEVIDEVKVNDTLVHEPEVEQAPVKVYQYSQNRVRTTADHVFSKLFNKN